MSYILGEDYRSLLMEQRMEDELTDMAWEQVKSEVVTDLQYRSYRWQRKFYGVEAERLAKHFPRAEAYERMYQEEQQGKAA